MLKMQEKEHLTFTEKHKKQEISLKKQMKKMIKKQLKILVNKMIY